MYKILLFVCLSNLYLIVNCQHHNCQGDIIIIGQGGGGGGGGGHGHYHQQQQISTYPYNIYNI